MVYSNNWVIANTHELEGKIERCSNDLKRENVVRVLGGATKKRLRKMYLDVLYRAFHWLFLF